jgi:hypothetical protein
MRGTGGYLATDLRRRRQQIGASWSTASTTDQLWAIDDQEDSHVELCGMWVLNDVRIQVDVYQQGVRLGLVQ